MSRWGRGKLIEILRLTLLVVSFRRLVAPGVWISQPACSQIWRCCTRSSAPSLQFTCVALLTYNIRSCESYHCKSTFDQDVRSCEPVCGMIKITFRCKMTSSFVSSSRPQLAWSWRRQRSRAQNSRRHDLILFLLSNTLCASPLHNQLLWNSCTEGADTLKFLLLTLQSCNEP